VNHKHYNKKNTRGQAWRGTPVIPGRERSREEGVESRASLDNNGRTCFKNTEHMMVGVI
jgi:hypothetical protein